MLEARIGHVVPEELDFVEFARFVHHEEQVHDPFDRLDRHRLPADQDVAFSDRFAKALEGVRIVEFRSSEVLERPIHSGQLAKTGKREANGISALVGGPRGIADDSHMWKLRPSESAYGDGHHLMANRMERV
jgi:hypothetical protein